MRIVGAIVLGVLAAAGCERLLALDPVSTGDAAAADDAPPGDGSGVDPCSAPFAYYQFEKSSALLDSSGNYFDGAILDPAPLLTMGHQGYAYAFDGSDTVVELDAMVYAVTPLTVSFWFQPEPGGATDSHCMINQLTMDQNGNDADAWQLCLDVDTLFLYSSTMTVPGGTAAYDSWHHVAIELDGSDALLWLDGSGSSAPFPLDYKNANKITIGADRDGTYDAFYDGAIDELKFFHCAVPADQLDDL